jgi:hypothetical protein
MLFIFVTSTLAQMDEYGYHLKDQQASFKKIWKKAKKEKAENHTKDALGLYEAAVKMDSTNPVLLYEIANFYQEVGAYIAANKYYTKLTEQSKTAFADLHLRRGSMQQILGQYAAAIDSYNTCKRSGAGDMQLVNTYIEQCREAITLMKRQDCPINFNGLHNLKDPVNDKSGETAEFSPYYENGELYFSRFQYADEKGSSYSLNSFKHKTTDNGGVYQAIPTKAQSSAYLIITPEGDALYEVACEEEARSFDNSSCRIYRRDRKNDGTWSDRILLPETINAKESLNTQPAVGTDTEGNTYLYFASDREGGQGKMDIWRSQITADNSGNISYAPPTNLNQINTSDDEISPYYHQKCHTFYFSSNRRPSLGGFDIYQTIWNGTNYGWSKANHLCYPINGSFDDVDFFRSATGEKVYFASKRVPEEEQQSEDRLVKGCCLDIFEAEADLPVFLDLAVKCGKDTLVTDAYYTMSGMTDKEEYLMSGDSAVLVMSPIALVANEQYTFDIMKTGWTRAALELPTTEICEPTTYPRTVYMRPNDNLRIRVVGQKGGRGVGLDFAKVTVESEWGRQQKKEAPGGEVTFNVETGTTTKTYTITVEYEDYQTRTMEVVIPPLEERCLTELEIPLISKILDRNLEANIYFHNNSPAIIPNKAIGEVDSSYAALYTNYIKPDMRNSYKTQLRDFYQSNGELVDLDVIEEEIDSFFVEEVKAGFEKLNAYAEALVDHFNNGSGAALVIDIKGSASPTASADYNLDLSRRRISSVKNYLLEFEEGALKPFIDNRQLLIREVPIGQDVDFLSNAEKAKIVANKSTYGIYSPAAASARRVTLQRISLQNPN